MDLYKAGENIVRKIKRASWYPYASGNLRDHATKGELVDDNTYCITFDTTVAPYITCLEEGTQPHDIPFAFVGKGNWVWWYPYDDGIPFLFGMGY